MPGKPHYAMDNRVWFLNDLYHDRGVMVGDFVDVEDRLDHIQVEFEAARRHKIHDIKVDVHTVNQSGRRRMPHEGMVRVAPARIPFAALMGRHPNKWNESGDYQPWMFQGTTRAPMDEFDHFYKYLTGSGKNANFNWDEGYTSSAEWFGLGVGIPDWKEPRGAYWAKGAYMS